MILKKRIKRTRKYNFNKKSQNRYL